MQPYIEQIYKLEKAENRPVVFLDRDGTLIKDVNYLSSSQQIELLPGVIEGIQLLNKNNFIIVVITNQPVVAKGFITSEQLQTINDTFVSLLNKNNAFINAIFSCPHHPNADLAMYRANCVCRKPHTALFEKAVEVFQITIENSVVIGDSMRDIDAGKNLNIPTYLLQFPPAKIPEIHHDFIYKDFLSAVKMVIHNI